MQRDVGSLAHNSQKAGMQVQQICNLLFIAGGSIVAQLVDLLPYSSRGQV